MLTKYSVVASFLVLSLLGGLAQSQEKATVKIVPFEVKLDTVIKHDDRKFLWFHPRVAAAPGFGDDGKPRVLMTIQKIFNVSDYYSGLHMLSTDDMGKTWTKPAAIPELDWVKDGKVDIAVADVTPGWHAPTKKILAVGAQVRYSAKGEQLDDIVRAHQTAYAVFDPKTKAWTKWRQLEMPKDEEFNFARSACSQFLVEPDGTVLLPCYIAVKPRVPRMATVVRCTFDGTELKYKEHGNFLVLKQGRGYSEPSLVNFQGKYFMTIRSDARGYVSTSKDGLHYEPVKAWTFDDGKELGSYSTQQHWLAHSDGLFLCYTRKGANNDHVFRHRAPLFIAQVDPDKLQVIRSTEKILMPDRGATFGNFGAAAITPQESWVSDSEGVFSNKARARGADGSTYVARVIWMSPNKLVDK